MAFQLLVSYIGDSVVCRDRPSYSNLIVWGLKNPSQLVEVEKQLQPLQETYFCSSNSTTSVAKLRGEGVICVMVDGRWMRAKPVSFSLNVNGQLEVDCIDYGLRTAVPIADIRILPPDATYLRNINPLASKFVLADVLVEKCVKAKEPTIQYLKSTFENRIVTAVTMGVHNGWEGIRVYTESNLLLARVLVERGMGVAAASYTDALKLIPPNLSSCGRSISPAPPMAKSADSQRTLLAGSESGSTPQSSTSNSRAPSSISSNPHYRAGILEQDVDHVLVTSVQNGPFKFVVQKKGPETEASLARLQQVLAQVKLEPLTNPARGVPCIVTSAREERLYRGLLVDSSPNVAFSVYYVDYGHTEPYNAEKTFSIPVDLMAMDLLAARVRLAEASELEGVEGVAETFSKLVLSKTFRCKVVDSVAPQQLHLFDEKTGRSIKDTIMIKSKILAQEKERTAPPTLPKSTQSVPQPTHTRANLKVVDAEVEAEECLFVTWAGKPGHFFGQLVKRPEIELREMEKELVSVYGDPGVQLPLLYAVTQSQIGEYGIIRWSDGNFYRVQVIEELTTANNAVMVRLIDYGDVITVHRHEIWAPVKTLTLFTQQPFGVVCLVENVNLLAENWTKLLTDRTVRVQILRSSADVNRCCVVSFTNCQDNQDILEALKERKNPSALSPLAPPFQSSGVHQGAESAQSYTPRPTILEKNPSAYPEFSVIEEDAEDAVSNHSSTPIGQPPSLSDFEREQHRRQTSTAALTYPPQPDLVGSTKNLEVVHVVSPSSFYCQLAEVIPSLDELMEELAAVYKDSAGVMISSPEVGMACVAKYSADGGWYRGVIVGLDGSSVDVLFVDYGNQERSPVNSVRHIKEQFVRLPPQGYHCELVDVKNDKCWTSEDKTRFVSATDGIKTLSATFMRRSSDDKYGIRLIDRRSDGTVVDIGESFGALPRFNVPAPTTSFSPLSVTYGMALHVSVAWHYSSQRFFLSPTDLSEYQAALDSLEEFYSSLSRVELIEDSPKIDLPCVVRFLDDQRFYRSKITHLANKMAKVVFVDFGNEQDTPLDELKRIIPQFLQCPQLALECKLKGVKDVSSPGADITGQVDSMFLTAGDFTAVFYPPDSDGVFPVDLTVPGVGDASSHLLRLGAVQSTAVEVVDDAVLTEQNLQFTQGEIIATKAVIPFVKSANAFWIQLDPDLVDEIMDRTDSLSLQPEFDSGRFALAHLVVGRPCLACFAEDGRWYRARVDDVKGDMVTVYFIDYGNSSQINVKNIKRLPYDLAQQPALAYRCALDGAAVVSDKTKADFEAIAVEFVGSVKFVKNVDGILHVRLLTSDDGRDLNDQLGFRARPEETEVYVAYAKSPSLFWIQMKKDEDTVAEIQDKLLELDGDNRDTFRVIQPVPGDRYAAIHPEYGTWYRATFTYVKNGMADAYFYDYGDTHQVPITDFRSLPASVMNIPSMAIRCSLSLQRDWSKEATNYFISSCPPDVVCKVVFGETSNGIQLIDSLVTPASDVMEVLSTMPSSSSRSASPDEYLDDVETPSEMKSPTSPKDDSPASVIVFPSYTPGQVLSDKALAVCMTSTLAVWLQLDPSISRELADRVNHYVTQPKFNQLPPLEPRVGASCLALFELDGQWYRASILSVDGDQVTVRYIDFGNKTIVHRDSLRALPAELSEPAAGLAIECALDGTDRCPGIPLSECQSAIFDKTLTVTVVNQTDEHLFVRLCDAAGLNINERILGPTKSQPRGPSPLPSLPVVSGEEVCVSFIETPCVFWIQRQKDKEVVAQIDSCLSTLNQRGERGDYKVDDLCAVIHPSLKKWFRGCLLNIEGNCVQVHFIDRGDIGWVDKTTDILPCPALLRYVPPMATKCTFRAPACLDVFSEEVRKAFIDCTNGFVCRAVFGPTTGAIQEVEVLYGVGGINVANHLAGMTSPRSDKSGGSDNVATSGRSQPRCL